MTFDVDGGSSSFGEHLEDKFPDDLDVKGVNLKEPHGSFYLDIQQQIAYSLN